MTLCSINDTHIGAVRAGGTTPVTQVQLRQETLEAFVALLVRCDGSDVLINGDLFDAFMVPFSDLWGAVQACVHWGRRNPQKRLYAARGNHDIAKNTMNMSSFDLFVNFLDMMLGAQFVAITEPRALTDHDAIVIPHMPNQDLFNEAMKAVPKAKFLFVHANYDNKFALESDHSLNVSPEQAEAAPVDFIVFGHEHQRRTELKGKVVVVGNQIPTSVADCLGNDVKYMLRIKANKIEHLPVWKVEDDFARLDWKDLLQQHMTTVPKMAALSIPQRFIRVQGEASAAEASQVISLISKFRSKSKALVITNAVTIDGVANDDEMRMSLESVKSFDVLAAVLALLDEGWERNTVKNLIEKHNVQTTQAD